MTDAQASAIAAHRFGLGEPSLALVGGDAVGWLQAQIGPADLQRASAPEPPLARTADALLAQRRLQQQRRAARLPGSALAAGESGEAGAPAAAQIRDWLQADVRARLTTAASTARPFAERLALFWSNHFTVSAAKAGARGMVGAFEREAIRPHIAGSFGTLLAAAVQHPAMLLYLDNAQSAGPASPLARRRAARQQDDGIDGMPPRNTGLNENLAREVLELHTVGADAGTTQADVTAFARVLTGWRPQPQPAPAVAATGAAGADASSPDDATGSVRFDAGWHEPGSKTVLGRSYGQGAAALPALLADLARHPATARHIAFKLARHFVADAPPPALVARLEASFLRSGGDLPALYRTLLAAPEAWLPGWPKMKTPEEFIVSSARLLGLGATAFARAGDGGAAALGQRVQAAPSPAGWPDRAEDWLGPDAVWKRVEWATRLAGRSGRQTDARRLAGDGFGPALSENTALQIARAADGPQALALLLLAPEFQRR